MINHSCLLSPIFTVYIHVKWNTGIRFVSGFISAISTFKVKTFACSKVLGVKMREWEKRWTNRDYYSEQSVAGLCRLRLSGGIFKVLLDGKVCLLLIWLEERHRPKHNHWRCCVVSDAPDDSLAESVTGRLLDVIYIRTVFCLRGRKEGKSRINRNSMICSVWKNPFREKSWWHSIIITAGPNVSRFLCVCVCVRTLCYLSAVLSFSASPQNSEHELKPFVI